MTRESGGGVVPPEEQKGQGAGQGDTWVGGIIEYLIHNRILKGLALAEKAGASHPCFF